jgi:hypothetical protein
MAAACVAIPLVAMFRPAVASEDLDVPTKFSASIGGRMAAYSVELEGAALLYRAQFYYEPQNGKTIRIFPTRQQWREFRRAIDEIDIWKWRPRYHRNVTDAGGWSLDIQYSDRTLETSGDAGVPEETSTPGSCWPTTEKPFRRFLAAVQRLIGGRTFGRRIGPLDVFEVAELQLVATHPAANPREQWAAFRDPRGKVHRVRRIVADRRDEPTPQSMRLPESTFLVGVMPTSVSLSMLCQDASGEWFERVWVVNKLGAP